MQSMWQLYNQTKFAADWTWIQDRDGAKHWVVVVKATYDILPTGELALADQQIPPSVAAESRGKDGETSLLYEADLIGPKPGTDVYLNAEAHAPDRRPTTAVDAALAIGDRKKILAVTGDRTWVREVGVVTASPPAPFVQMPIVYERAFGGFDADDPDPAEQALFAANQVGVGVASSRVKLLGTPVPNIEYPDTRFGARGAAGFGAINCHWSSRVQFGGTYDTHWSTTRKPLLPADFEDRYFMCAPPDQQFIPHLRGGEVVTLLNLTPSGSLRFALPRVAIGLETKISGGLHHHRALMNTVIIEPEVPRVIVVWHGALKCHREMDYLERTLIREKRYI